MDKQALEPRSLSDFLARHPQPTQFVQGVRFIAAAFDFILRLPTSERPEAYPAALAVAREGGFAMSGLPATYDDETERALRHYLALCGTIELCHAQEARESAGALH